jgi:hypothetical protein
LGLRTAREAKTLSTVVGLRYSTHEKDEHESLARVNRCNKFGSSKVSVCFITFHFFRQEMKFYGNSRSTPNGSSSGFLANNRIESNKSISMQEQHHGDNGVQSLTKRSQKLLSALLFKDRPFVY